MENLWKLFYRLGAVILLFCCLGTAGCGSQEEAESTQDILNETTQKNYGADDVNTSDMIEYAYLGSQFWQGERIQIWGERRLDGCSIYLHREDSSRELLAEGVSSMLIGSSKWWIDSEKRCFVLESNKIVRINSEGTIVFSKELDEYWCSICQLEDSRIIVLLMGDGRQMLAELDPDSGSMEEFKDIQLNGVGLDMIAAEGNKVLLLDLKGVCDVNLTDGKVNELISFVGTSYALKNDNTSFDHYLVKEDFHLLEDGRMELLWSDGTVETLGMEQVAGGVITLRINYADSWLKEQIVIFNQENENYHIVIEERGDSDLQTFRERTDMELGTGKGADLISNDAVNDAYSLLEKGVFEDLAPYMEASGIREEDYFPAAFSCWKYDDRIYGANYTAEIEGMYVDTAIAGEEGISGGQDLMDRLLAYDEDAVFWRYMDTAGLLNFFLKDSESLCGMVDLERGTCDFSGEVFGKLLETAKRYGYEDAKAEWMCLADPLRYYTFYCFNDSGYLKQNGKAVTGYLFDDGGRPEIKENMLAINKNSANKEGAWEFISFLLGEEVQSDFNVMENYARVDQGVNMGSFPVSRSAFEKLCSSHSEVINDGVDVVYTDNGREVIITGLTEARKEELRTALEEARSAPLQTQPLIQIILEEADAYFSGTKTLDEVRDLIENRVQLYLNERN